LCFVSRETVKEDDDGLLESNVAEIVARAKRYNQLVLKPSLSAIQLGMMRHLYVMVDACH